MLATGSKGFHTKVTYVDNNVVIVVVCIRSGEVPVAGILCCSDVFRPLNQLDVMTEQCIKYITGSMRLTHIGVNAEFIS